MKLLNGGLCLITFALVPYCMAQSFFDLRQENESKDPSFGEQNTFEAASELEQSIDDSADDVLTHRHKKSLKLHRPHFFGSQNKITGNRRPLAKESLQKEPGNAEILNSLHEKAALDERDNEADKNNAQSFIFPPKLFGKQVEHSRVQKSLDDILSSVQKREVDMDESGIGNVEALSSDTYEGNKHRDLIDSRGRIQTNLLDAQIKDLTSQINALGYPKSKLIGDKSDLELLHDIIDKNKNSGKFGQSETGNRKIKKFETASFYESSLENSDASSSRKQDVHRSGKESSHDTSKEEVAGSLLDSDLERMIQEAAEKISAWVNENFDTAKKVKKTQVKGGSVKKQHSPKHANTSNQEMAEELNPLKPLGTELDEETKKSALKLFLHAVTPDPEAKNLNEGDTENGLDEVPKKRKNKGIRLSVGEVKKMKMTNLPPCFTSTSRHPECAKCLPTVSAKDLDPKLLEALCSKPTAKPPCTHGLTPPSSGSTTPNNATRKTRLPSTPRSGKSFTTEMIDRNTALSDKLYKKLVNATFKEALADNLVEDRNSSYSKVDLTNLADFLRILVNAAEGGSNNVTHLEFPCNKLDEFLLNNKSEQSKVKPNLNSAKTSNNKLLNHFVSLAALDGTAKKLRPVSVTLQPTEQSDSPLKALSGVVDLMRRQSSETVSSHKSLLEDKAVSEHLHIPPSENQTVALNVFIKAAIIPDFKNATLKHAAKAAVRAERLGVQPGRVETTRLRNADPMLTSPRSQFTDNTLNNLLRSIIVKARLERQVETGKCTL